METSLDDKDVSQNVTVSEQTGKTTYLFKGTQHSTIFTSKSRSKLIQTNH
jgi:hypothetical protein